MKFNSFLKLINTPPSRYVLRKITNKKTRTGSNLLEEYLTSYFSGAVSDDLKSFMNYKTKMFNFGMNIVEKTIMKNYLTIKKQNSSPLDNKFSRAMQLTLKSIGAFGINRPMLYTNPSLTVWNFTNQCFLKCIHCYKNAGPLEKNELTLREKYNVVDQVVDLESIALDFTGGEPLMSKHFFKVAEYAGENGLIIRLATNGILITKNVAKRLAKMNFDVVSISLDGSTKKTHERIRGVPGSFDRAIEGIKNCLEEGVPTSVIPTLTKYNYKEIEGIIELSKNLGVNDIVIADFVPCGRGQEHMNLDIPPKVRHEVFINIIKKSLEDKNTKISIFSPLYQYEINNFSKKFSKSELIEISDIGSLLKFRGIPNLYNSGCCAGRMYFVIEPNGDIKPCTYIDIVAGNTKKDRIKDVWNNSEVFKALRTREDLKGNCGKCKDKYICGGCRARALIYSKDLKACDPGCIKNI